MKILFLSLVLAVNSSWAQSLDFEGNKSLVSGMMVNAQDILHLNYDQVPAGLNEVLRKDLPLIVEAIAIDSVSHSVFTDGPAVLKSLTLTQEIFSSDRSETRWYQAFFDQPQGERTYFCVVVSHSRQNSYSSSGFARNVEPTDSVGDCKGITNLSDAARGTTLPLRFIAE